MEQRKVKLKNIIGYGAADLFGNGSLTVVSTWMLFYFTTFCGLTPIQSGSILALARVADSIISPLIGYITDHFGNTRLGKKFGRRRFFILLGCPLMVIYLLLWLPNAGYFYYLIMYILVEVLAAGVMIPYETLASEMTVDYDIRTKMTSSRMLFSSCATFLAAWLPGRIFTIIGKDNPQAFFINALILSVIFIIALLVTYFSTWERTAVITKQNESQSVVKKIPKKNKNIFKTIEDVLIGLSSCFKIRTYRLHLIMYICSFTAGDIVTSMYVYYVVYAMKTSQIMASNILTAGTIIGIICNFFWPVLMRKLGPSKLLRILYIMMAGTTIGYGLIYISPISNTATAIVLLYIVQFFWGIANSGRQFVPWSLYVFIPDVDEIVTKRRREGQFAGVMTFARKTTAALASFLTGVILQSIGFTKGSESQTSGTLNGIVLYLVISTFVLLLMAFVTTYYFKLSKENHIILIDEINRLKNNGKKEAVDNNTKKLVENLTGFKYEKLWGNNTVGLTTKKDYKKHYDVSQ